jgi:hypothetical protein
MEDDTYRNTEFCQHYRDWAQALKRNYEALKAEQSTVSPARDLSTSTRTAQVVKDCWTPAPNRRRVTTPAPAGRRPTILEGGNRGMLRGGSNWQPLWRFDRWRCRPGLDKPVEMPADAEMRTATPLFLQSRAMSFGAKRLI